jgi:hypothetical protein
MSKKKSFHLKYSILFNQEEYAREYTVKGAKSKLDAEEKLRRMCSSEIVITSNEEII